MISQLKKYVTTFIRWGHNATEGRHEPTPPDSSGPWTLEEYQTTLLDNDDRSSIVLHSYVWSTPSDDTVIAKLPTRYWGVDVLATLEQSEALKKELDRYTLLLKDANQESRRIQDLADKMRDERDKANGRVAELQTYEINNKEYEALYRGSQAELLEVTRVEETYKRQVDAQRSIIDEMYKNPLKNIKRGPQDPSNMHVNAVLARVWSLGMVSVNVGKNEFLWAFYGTGKLEDAEKVAETFPDYTDQRWNGSERIAFLERELARAKDDCAKAKSAGVALQERLNRVSATLKGT
jgi:hypothetical protein